MAKDRTTITRKRRTREHVIADLSVNQVERFVLRCGWTAERTRHDYGIDLFVETYTAEGEVENGRILLQLKATDKLPRSADGTVIPIRLEWRDLLFWLNEPLPVLLVVYDAQQDSAYWLYVQDYCRTKQWPNRSGAATTATVHVPVGQVLDETAVRKFGQLRDACQAAKIEDPPS